jgi:hypothetical protein
VEPLRLSASKRIGSESKSISQLLALMVGGLATLKEQRPFILILQNISDYISSVLDAANIGLCVSGVDLS